MYYKSEIVVIYVEFMAFEMNVKTVLILYIPVHPNDLKR